MPRYIDADTLISKVCGYYCGCERTECGMEEINEPCKRVSFIEDAPTISPDEVRGVVHCGECKFWRRPPSCEGLARCETGETGIRYRSKNDFCSRGAKMEVSEDA